MVITRPTKIDTFMMLAGVWAERSTCSSRISVGAVLVNKHFQVIASGYNGSPKGLPHCNSVGCIKDSDGHCVSAVHAEENAILQCAANGVQSRGTVIFVTHLPCDRCAMRIIQAGIVAVFYKDVYGDVSKTRNILNYAKIKLFKV